MPTTILAFEADFIDWHPGARIPSWPEVLGDLNNEAGDTFAVRPVPPQRNGNERPFDGVDRKPLAQGGA